MQRETSDDDCSEVSPPHPAVPSNPCHWVIWLSRGLSWVRQSVMHRQHGADLYLCKQTILIQISYWEELQKLQLYWCSYQGLSTMLYDCKPVLVI